jgi:hypothetical protein
MKHSVKTYRSAGLEARWGRTRLGAPVIFVRNPNANAAHQRNQWWMVTKSMFDAAQTVGALEAFDRETLLGDVFSISA